MTRIIAGSAKGRKLAVPQKGTRPTPERVREAIFSKLEHYDALAGVTVLDLYAGTGALGLEALSRGALRAALVDKSQRACDLIRQNVRATDFRANARVYPTSAAGFLENDEDMWDLVFIDPPYDVTNEQIGQLLESLLPKLRPAAVVVLERAKRDGEPPLPEGLDLITQKNYGDTTVYYADTAPMPQKETDNG